MGGFFWRALFAVLVFGAVAAIGAGLYHAGYNQGLDTTVTGAGGTVIVAREHWGPGPWGFLGLLFPLFFFFLLFSFIGRMIFWGRGGGWGDRGGPGEHRWQSRHEAFEDWHRHAHETPNAPSTSPGAAPEPRG